MRGCMNCGNISCGNNKKRDCAGCGRWISPEDKIAELERENAELRKQLFSAKPTCNNCGHCDCENYQMQRRSEPCALWISHKDQLSKAKENIQKLTKLLDIAGDYFYEDEYLEAERFLRGC